MNDLLDAIPDIVRRFDAAYPHFPDGRIDYSHVSASAVVNAIVVCRKKVLLLKRSDEVRVYRGQWYAVGGFYDELVPLRVKILEEVQEELAISPDRIVGLTAGTPVTVPDPAVNRVWTIHPVRVDIDRPEPITIDWEHTEYRWVAPGEIGRYGLAPQLSRLIATLVPGFEKASS